MVEQWAGELDNEEAENGRAFFNGVGETVTEGVH